MAQPFDATLKRLIETDPWGWLRLAGLPYTSPDAVEVIDAELSTVTAEADRVIRAQSPAREYLAHLELQARYDPEMASRLLRYNVLLRYRYRVPVKSVVILLRPEANGPRLTGNLRYDEDEGSTLAFDYSVIRLWQQPVDTILQAGLGVLPIAPLTAVGPDELPEIVHTMERRIQQEATPAIAGELWTATYILLGLRYSAEQAATLLREVRGMEESVTYQLLIAKGEARGETRGEARGEARGELLGRAKEARKLLVLFGANRLGQPGKEIQDRLEAIESPEVLEAMASRLLSVESWEELLSPS